MFWLFTCVKFKNNSSERQNAAEILRAKLKKHLISVFWCLHELTPVLFGKAIEIAYCCEIQHGGYLLRTYDSELVELYRFCFNEIVGVHVDAAYVNTLRQKHIIV